MPQLKVRDVFVPGRLPKYTYNPRTSANLESQLEDLIDEGGSVICVSGLTKMGKTVLVERIRPEDENIRVDGSQFTSLEEFWIAVGDHVGVYPSVTISASQGNAGSLTVSGEAGIPAFGKASGAGTLEKNAQQQNTYGATRPIVPTALEAWKNSGKTLIIDDFHFVGRDLQRAVIRSLKDPIFRGECVIVISTSHRTLDVIQAEPNMDGRAASLPVDLWSIDELKYIAHEGFRVLNIIDPGEEIASMLANNAFGSPHLMQKFCKKICTINGIRESTVAPTTLKPPENWKGFFKSQIEGVAERWFDRLVRGPQERGRARTRWLRRDGGYADNYVLVMDALARADGGFEISKDQIKKIVESLTDENSPGLGQTTRALQRISAIASKPLEEGQPTDEDVDEDSQGDIHFVLEYIEEGPNSKLHITDPFFAYYLRWGGVERVQKYIKTQPDDSDDDED